MHCLPPRFLLHCNTAATLVTALLLIFGCSWSDRATAADEKAQRLSKLLKAPPRSEKGKSSDIAGPKNTTIKVIEVLQASNRSNGPSAESFIDTAYSFRNDIATLEKVVTAAAYLRNWKEAVALGLFDDNHRFNAIITRGPDQGKMALVEYIVPPEEMPQMSKHPANIRIVAPSKQRSDSTTGLTEREIAHREQFQKMIAESASLAQLQKIERGTEYSSAGLSNDEEHKRWLAAMEAAGDAAKVAPNITIRARTGTTPSHRSNYRWRVDAEVMNNSRNPTKIKLEYWLVGVSDEKNIHYLMKKGSDDMELLAGEIENVEFWTNPEKSYKNKSGALDGWPQKQWKRAKVIFRGYLFRAVHETGEVAVFAPDRNLARYLDEEDDELTVGGLR